ncbi:hypothetical protein CAP36_08390 [Chitinophagaceae bacterium IBVUCB2]|nr:hypothetical protein CAP36_08390 [Chitinophagaceae bacterium IBVUCB2]
MRLLTILVIPFLLYGCISKREQEATGNTVAPSFDEKKEQAAIMSVIEKETDCFFKRDYECWKQCFAQTDYSFQAWNNSDGTVDTKSGWKEIDKRIKSYLTNPENQPKKKNMGQEQSKQKISSSHPTVIRKNMVWKFFSPQLAYLMWDQYNSDPDEKRFTFSKDCRIIEKINSEWKIVNVSSYWDYRNMHSFESLK